MINCACQKTPQIVSSDGGSDFVRFILTFVKFPFFLLQMNPPNFHQTSFSVPQKFSSFEIDFLS